MKKLSSWIFIFLLSGTILISMSCMTGWRGEDRDFRHDMRSFVQAISEYARAKSAGFVIIPQNGSALATLDGDPGGAPAAEYLAAIDGMGREDLNYGYDGDNIATSGMDKNEMIPFLDLATASGVTILVTDYCSETTKMDDSYTSNQTRGYISFAADSRDLDTIPTYPQNPFAVHGSSVENLSDAKNFLYLLDPSQYQSKTAYLGALRATDFDAIIFDLFYEDAEGTVWELTSSDLAQIKTKANGGQRLLICYTSIGEAEDYRYYWDPSWNFFRPSWLDRQNPNWRGNYKVQYWNPDWQALIFGGSNAYLDKILSAGFDGVYLDIIDAYEYFESG